tara:strand:- start:2402 stop:3631 length:1230 start_codon:yes stop_codon:yes gene_type:complete
MAQKKAAVEVKQEGDFKLKSKPKLKPKDLSKKNEGPVKVDFTKPEAQGEVIPEVVKVDLTDKKETDAVQERKTEEVPVVETSGDSKEVDAEVRVLNIDENADSGATIEKIEESSETKVSTSNNEQEKEIKKEINNLPENINKLVDFMNDTGGNIEDYVRLNRDYSNIDENMLLKEYYKNTKPHLNDDEVNFMLEDNFSFDEDVDEQRDIKKKKLAKKEAVAEAQKHLEDLKNKYYDSIKTRSVVNEDQQKALDFFNRYQDEQKTAETRHEYFKNATKELFSEDFKGFDFKVGEQKFRYNVKNPHAVADKQSNLNTFINNYVDDQGNMIDPAGYHKAMYTAMNSDQLANHFYEQGKADGIKQVVDGSKNPDTDAPRQVAGGDVFVKGFKVKAVSGVDSSKLRIKKRKFNN